MDFGYRNTCLGSKTTPFGNGGTHPSRGDPLVDYMSQAMPLWGAWGITCNALCGDEVI